MIRKVVVGAGLALLVTVFGAVSALAYTGTAGTSASTSNSYPAAGGSTNFTAHFTGGSGQSVTFSASGGGSGCTVTFTPNPGTTDASGNITTSAVVGSSCSGNVNLTAVTGAQNVTATITIGGLPAASGQGPVPSPGLWLAIFILGLGLIAVSLFGFRRRQQPVTA